jgi:hypothetical protein
VAENRVLRRISGPMREEVAGVWKRLHNEKLHNLSGSPNIIWVIKSRRTRWAEHIARMGELTNAYNILLGKREGKRPFGRSRCRWQDNIRTDLREIWWEGVDGVHMAQDRDQGWDLVNTVMNHLLPLRSFVTVVVKIIFVLYNVR